MGLTKTEILMLKIGVPVFVVIIAIVGIVLYKSNADSKKKALDTSKISETFNQPPAPKSGVVNYTEAEWADIEKYPRELATILFNATSTIEWIEMIRYRDSAKMRRTISDENFNIILNKPAYDYYVPATVKFSDEYWKYAESVPKGPVFTLYVPTNIFKSVISSKDNTKMRRILAIGIIKKQTSDYFKSRGNLVAGNRKAQWG